jgi:hypothetical protein
MVIFQQFPGGTDESHEKSRRMVGMQTDNLSKPHNLTRLYVCGFHCALSDCLFYNILVRCRWSRVCGLGLNDGW